jgi:hypothetical protein
VSSGGKTVSDYSESSLVHALEEYLAKGFKSMNSVNAFAHIPRKFPKRWFQRYPNITNLTSHSGNHVLYQWIFVLWVQAPPPYQLETAGFDLLHFGDFARLVRDRVSAQEMWPRFISHLSVLPFRNRPFW